MRRWRRHRARIREREDRIARNHLIIGQGRSRDWILSYMAGYVSHVHGLRVNDYSRARMFGEHNLMLVRFRRGWMDRRDGRPCRP